MSPHTKTGPKRRRRTRRDWGYGPISQWRMFIGNPKREREARLNALRMRDELDEMRSRDNG